MAVKPQRIRDPLHDIISFDSEEFDRTMWEVIQSAPFQRLRRIKQLGFSELTFPGATHTRFSHSIGVFHTARQLVRVINAKAAPADRSPGKANIAVAAALLHDVGHGMFSHAFEKVGAELGIDMAVHEQISENLITKTPISDILNRGHIRPEDVATVIGRKGPGDLYDAVVSSQFDADRLDYIRRDRMMTGAQGGSIDFPWLLDNLEIGEVRSSSEEAGAEAGRTPDYIKTFVLGPKAILAGEQYILALFQLYPAIFFHKATRAAEVVFKTVMIRLLTLAREGVGVGLPDNHPLIKFANAPDQTDSSLELDDTVFWGSLGLLVASRDEVISRFALSLRDRRLPKATDIGPEIQRHVKRTVSPNAKKEDFEKVEAKVEAELRRRFSEYNQKNLENGSCILFDIAARDPYSVDEDKGPLNRIHVKSASGNVSDIAEYSRMVAALKPFKFVRAYTYAGDHTAEAEVAAAIADVTREGDRDDA